MSLHLILPANASHDRYPDNKNNNYKIHLPQRLKLEGGTWEIALRSISFNNNWFNVKNGYIEATTRRTGIKTRIDVKDGKYKSVAVLLRAIHATSENLNLEKKIQLFHDTETDKMFLMFFTDDIKVKFSPDLAAIFGFDATKEYTRPSVEENYVEASAIPDIHAGYDNMYVYCSLCANTFVGDALVPCLYNVPVYPHNKSSAIVHQTIQPPMYVPAIGTDTDEVEIDIRRGDGQPVLFRGGCVIVTVHLRKRKVRS